MIGSRISQLVNAGVQERDGEGATLVDGTGGVFIHVDISPRACIEACGELPATGGGVPEVLLAVGIVLVLAGIVFVATRLIRRRSDRE